MKQNQVCRFNKYFYRELYPNRYQEVCRAIAINHDNTLIIAAAESNIKVIQIILPLLSQSEAYPTTRITASIRQIEILKGKHQDFVSALVFFKKTSSMRNSFISGSEDSTIIIWSPLNSFEFTIPCKWEAQCILKEHTNCISCLVLLTPSEDLIISGSYDKKIKFWSLSSTQPPSPSLPWICSQTIEEHSSTIFGLSINQEGTRLISCGSDFQILVMEGSNKSQWNIKQRIQVDQWGYRLSFINSHVFTFQPIETTNQLQGSAHIHIYIYNPQKEQFQKSKTVLIQGGGQPCRPYFPQQYIGSMNILLSKNGHYINLIRIISSPSKFDVECNLEQTINFGIVRQIYFETFIILTDLSYLKYFNPIFLCNQQLEYLFHLYELQLTTSKIQF